MEPLKDTTTAADLVERTVESVDKGIPYRYIHLART